MTEAYAQLLSTAPGSCAEIRKELEKIHGVKIAGSSYERVWDSLVGYFGADGAASVVEDIVEIRNIRKRLTRMMGKRDKVLIESMLMKEIEASRKRGRTNLRKAQVTQPAKPVTPKRRKRIISHDHIELPSVEYGVGIQKGVALAYRPIERITPAGVSPLRARSDWLERNLENYLESHWAELDFGFGRKMQLVDRQAELSDTKEKVDLLARMGDIVLPVELKIKRAGGSDLTQLLSYRKDLINNGQAPENVLGVLVAPVFSSKVLNVVEGTPGVVLRWFEMPM